MNCPQLLIPLERNIEKVRVTVLADCVDNHFSSSHSVDTQRVGVREK